MDKNRIEGGTRQVRDVIRETLGKIFGETRVQTESTVAKADGRARSGAGRVEDTGQTTRND